MLLLVIGIPMTSVIVSMGYLWIAVSTFDGVVADDYYRQGKEINRLIQRDENAAVSGLRASISIANNRVTANVSSDLPQQWPEHIEFGLRHPTQDGRDQILQLTKGIVQSTHDQQYEAQLPHFNEGEWIIQLTTPSWRLSQRGMLQADVQFELSAGHPDLQRAD